MAILAFGIGALISFEYWRGNEEKKELETLMKQADQEKYDTYKIERPDKNINENRP